MSSARLSSGSKEWLFNRRGIEILSPPEGLRVPSTNPPPSDGKTRPAQIWLRTSVEQLIELYETQAEIFRAQVRRLEEGGNDSGNEGEAAALEADLCQLRQAAASTVPEP